MAMNLLESAQRSSTKIDGRGGSARIWLCRIQKLAAATFGTALDIPNTPEGEAFLLVEFCFGLTDEAALAYAPWLDEAKLRQLKWKGFKMQWQDAGQPIKLTIEQLQAFRLGVLRPFGMSPDDFEAWRKKHRREIELRSKHKRRQERKRAMEKLVQMPVAQENQRRAAILKMLNLCVRAPATGMYRRIALGLGAHGRS
jgi:hypothetical protein